MQAPSAFRARRRTGWASRRVRLASPSPSAGTNRMRQQAMPLARYALSAWGCQVYVAPTWDRGEPWLSTMRHVAKEMRCVVVGCCQAVRTDDIPDALPFKTKYLSPADAWINPGDSVIVDPDGKFIAGPVREHETILYADARGAQLIGPPWQLDGACHFARPAVFELRVRPAATPR